MLILSMIGTFATLFGVFWKGRSFPTNYILLSAFTLFEAHAVGTIGNV